MSSVQQNQCKALTESGERCSRTARENGFCHQHGQEDETVDEDGDVQAEANGEEPDESTDSQDATTMSEDSNSDTAISDVRDEVEHTAEDIVGHPLDGITSVYRDDGNWRVAVQVIERKGVPDTQDILGRYELTFTEDLSVDSYERTHRYRRDDMEHNV